LEMVLFLSKDDKADVNIRSLETILENNDVSKNVFEHQHLDAKVVALDPGKSTALVKLSGSLKMKHTFYNRPDDNVAEADVLGYLKIDTAARRLVAFDLTTTEATYGRGNFGVGVELAR